MLAPRPFASFTGEKPRSGPSSQSPCPSSWPASAATARRWPPGSSRSRARRHA
jgi:hypothetical protein